MSAAAKFTVGSYAWVEDPEVAWIDGEVLEINGEDIKVKCTSGKTVTVKAAKIYPKDPEFPRSGVEDMTRLAYLHEPGVLLNLNLRFDMNEIYTYTGNILIAVNPFQRIQHLYEDGLMDKYKGKDIGELSPHPYAVADLAYRQMINEKMSQSILVSGESGAGKTESTKMLMTYLAFMGGKKNDSGGRSVEQQVLESNPVLEAFGNAKTVRNNNSSRFGKFVELHFDQKGSISGAAIRTYLLEQSRVVQVSDPERNYHCFYMLCAAPSEDVKRFKLEKARSYHYLNQSSFFELTAWDDAKEYVATRNAMNIVGISFDEQDAIFRVVAAILNLGNIEFTKGKEDAAAPKDDKSRYHLKTAAELFMCDEKALEDSLCKRVIVTRGEAITKWLDPASAALSRDALAKIVYSKLFDWIVGKINNTIGQDADSKGLIGVLDIYGFEHFKTNSFEQFCINLTNEKLQQHFNQHVFKMEQEEYKKEQIDWSYIEFPDNQDILDLVEKIKYVSAKDRVCGFCGSNLRNVHLFKLQKPGGIIALLDEACMFPRSTHETFAQKLYQTFQGHKRFIKPKLSRTDFTICHYAGDVTYQTDLFLEKNKDFVVAEHQSLLNNSKCPFVASLFSKVAEESNAKASKFSSIGAKFKLQLQTLLETLNATEPHYIRCVKPNNVLKPSIFENFNVLQQLRCGGVMEAIRISCAGFPTRKSFADFVSRFAVLAPYAVDGSDVTTACKKIMEKANLVGGQVGKTKIFLRAGQMAELDARRTEVLGVSAAKIQRKVRGYLCRRHFLLLQQSAIQIQAFTRGEIVRYKYERMRSQAASIKIQKNLRMHLARKAHKNLCSSAINIQAGIRVMAARNGLRFRKQATAAIAIQRHCRRYIARVHYLKIKKGAIDMQCAWRGQQARKELRKLKTAAKDAGALQDAKSKLEKEVEDLTWLLQQEKQLRADAEEAKTREQAKFQSALEEMQLQLKEAREMHGKEQQKGPKKAAEPEPTAQAKEMHGKEQQKGPKKVAEQEPTVQAVTVKEVLVTDDEMVNKLIAENEELKAKIDELSKLSEERLKHASDAESKIIELKTDMLRLEEKLADMEAEDQILRQQVLLSGSEAIENRLNEPGSATKSDGADSGKFDSDKIYDPEDVDALIDCVKHKLGFTVEKPVATITIYKCLIHWGIFELDRTNVFDRLIQLIGSEIENQDDNDHLSYWLSNSSLLLFLVQRTLSPPRKPPTPTSLFGRMTQGFRSASSAYQLGVADFVQNVEAKYPALLFKQLLTAYVAKIFGIIKDNLKRELSPLFDSCILAPKTSSPETNYWHKITDVLNRLLSVLKENYVPSVYAQKIFTHVFSYINVRLFNSLLLKKECCTFSNGEYVKAGLAELEVWCGQATEEYAGQSWNELKHIRQAVGFLVIRQKTKITYDDITNDLCPILSVHQTYRLCTLYRDDNNKSEGVSSDVITCMKLLMTDSPDPDDDDIHSFLLDDHYASVPFSIDDTNNSLQEKEFYGVKPAAELAENPAFQFLKE